MRTSIRSLLASALLVLSPAGSAAPPALEVCSKPQLLFGGQFGSPVSATATITVPESVLIGDMQVEARVAHKWTPEFDLELTSPAGTKLLLKAGDGGPRGHEVIYFDGGVAYDSYPFDLGLHMQAEGGSFDVFDGEDAQGTWTLTLTDTETDWNEGVLIRWCLRFYDAPQPALPAPIRSLTPAPRPFGADLTWINGDAYDSIDVLVDGVTVAQLPGTATSYSLTTLPAGVKTEVAVRPNVAGGPAVDAVGYELVPIGIPPVPKTEKVVFVLIDGLRYSEGLGDPTRQYVPRMDALAQQGTIIEPFLCDGLPVTLAGLPALTTGSWEQSIRFFNEDCQVDNRYMPRPTVQEYYRRQLGRPASDCQYVIGVLYCPWSGSFHPSYGPSYDPQWVGTNGYDEDVFAKAKAAIANDQPSFLTLYLHDVDGAGHSGNWNAYVDAIEYADQVVGELWDLLQAHPDYAGKTTMIVTNDHGRHDYAFAGHGDGCDGCRNIQLLAIGPQIKKGYVSNVPRSIPDIAPTIGSLLGFQTEYVDGEVMNEIFDTSCQPDVGFGGPGQVTLSVCGGPLETGAQATLTLAGGTPGAAALMMVSLASAPTPFLGGTLAAHPVAATLPLALDPAGAWSVTFPGGGIGPLTAYAQCAVADPSQPFGAALSNALRLEFGP